MQVYFDNRQELTFKINDVNEVYLSDYACTISSINEVIKEIALVSDCGEINIKIKSVRVGLIDTKIVIDFIKFFSNPIVDGALMLSLLL